MKLIFCILISGFFCIINGCKTQTVEYRQRPSWHAALSSSTPTDYIKEDGTMVTFVIDDKKMTKGVKDYLDTLVLEERNKLTGELTLRAVFPDHMIVHTLRCLRDKNWDLLYKQLISMPTQHYYESTKNGKQEFESFFNENRREIARTFQRMNGGGSSGDIVITEQGNETVYTLSGRIASDYKFRMVSFLREGEYLKLHSIE